MPLPSRSYDLMPANPSGNGGGTSAGISTSFAYGVNAHVQLAGVLVIVILAAIWWLGRQ